MFLTRVVSREISLSRAVSAKHTIIHAIHYMTDKTPNSTMSSVTSGSTPSEDFEIVSPAEHVPRQPTPLVSAVESLCNHPGEEDSAVVFSRIQAVARQEGFAVRREGVKANCFYVLCVQSGEHKDDQPYIPAAGRLRKDSGVRTKKTGCTWKLYVARTKATKNLWRVSPRGELKHNHTLVGSPYGFPQHRRLTQAEKDAAIVSINNNVPAPAIIEELQQKAYAEGRETYVSPREIYNLKYQVKSVALQGRTPADAIIRQLKSKGIPHRYRSNAMGELQSLFFTSPMAIILAKFYSYVFIIDATYSSNKYQMPLMHIISMSPTNKTFTVGLAFLDGETTEEYIWGLQSLGNLMGNLPTEVVITDQCDALRNALTIVYPQWRQQLCVWHIGENLNQNFRPLVPKDDFQRIKSAALILRCEKNANTYEELRERFNESFLNDEKTSAAWLYVTNLHDAEGEYFLQHRLTKVLNFGEFTTSRGESLHKAIKNSIQGATSDLFSAVHACLLHMRSTHRLIFKEHATDAVDRIKEHPMCMATVSFWRNLPPEKALKYVLVH